MLPDEGPVLLLKFVRKDRSLLMHCLGWVLRPLLGNTFMTSWWTTLGSTIYYPITVQDPAQHHLVEHESVHAWQFRRWGWCAMVALTLLVPLPVLFSGRWFVERRAYLVDILGGHCTIEGAVNMLWQSYAWPWPRPWMRRWFEGQIRLHAAKK